MQVFTVEELAKYDGKDGRKAYVAFENLVYDVSDSAMWQDGEHVAMHDAGKDLTAEQDEAPHDAYITDFTVVGRLE